MAKRKKISVLVTGQANPKDNGIRLVKVDDLPGDIKAGLIEPKD